MSIEKALALHNKGSLVEAAAAYAELLIQNPEDSEALHLFGVLNHQIGHYQDAIKFIEEAIQHKPSGLYYNNIVDPYLALNELKKAEHAAQKAVKLMPQFANAFNQLGRVFHVQKKYGLALTAFRKALEIDPKNISVLNNMGNCYNDMHEFTKAREQFERAIEYDPSFVHAYANLALWHFHQGNYEEAYTCFNKTFLLEPGHVPSHINIGMMYLLQGNFEEGWEHYAWRNHYFKGKEIENLGPSWDGSSLANKTLFIHAEQGFGDTLHFIRYAKLIKAQHKNVRIIAAVQEPLMTLLAPLPEIDELIPQQKSYQHLKFHAHTTLLNLPHIMHANLHNIPNTTPYIPLPEYGPQLPEAKPRTKKIGLVWAGNKDHKNDHNRSIPFKQLVPLFDLPNTQFYSLQMGDEARMELRKSPQKKQIIDLAPLIHSFADTAYLIGQLDMVLSVDTSIVHLCGALNKPCWLMLPYVHDWRWLLNREDSPWYPSLTLFRQTKPQNWQDVITSIKSKII